MSECRCGPVVGNSFVQASSVTIAVVLAILFMSPSIARADASKEQCTCNLKTPGSSKLGSHTVNASACVRHDYQTWCDIYVATLENSRSHQQLYIAVLGAGSQAQQGDSSRLVSSFLELFDRYAVSVAADPMAKRRTEDDRKQLEALLKEHSKAIVACIDYFRTRKPATFREGRVSCSVGEVSGWLSINVPLGERSYSFLLAPGAG